ncbi:hypothetical protein [Reichenbachiella sp. MALMAid0571]|uniref:hypothetical protein n=1 Tax=Reichenbachiella sp. MALMAid0571 TaxID=3143939 RepID=UPI0032DF55F1
MKLIYLLSYLGLFCISYFSYGQKNLNNNGFNLTSLCSGESCKYISYSTPMHYPNANQIDWLMENFELVVKENGFFLASGDLHVTGVDMAAKIQLEFLFVDESNNNIFRFETDKFEFFNEPDYSEPISFTSQIPEELVSAISNVDVEIRYSEKIPYYQVNSNCFLPCKELKLKDAVKAFKKAK